MWNRNNRNVIQTHDIDDNKNESIYFLDKWKSLLENIEKIHGKDSIVYSRFKTEYNELHNSIEDSINTNNDITKSELQRIKLEYSHLQRLNSWKKERSLFDRWAWIAKKLNLTTSLLDTFWVDTNSLNTSQTEKIEKIMWNNKWFNEDFIAWYDNKVWNYIVLISDFENKIKNEELNIKDINSKTLMNYFKYLNSKNIQLEDLPNILWENVLKQLCYTWKNPDKYESLIVMKSIKKYKWWLDLVNYTKSFISPEIFISNIPSLTPIQQKLALKDLDNNVNNLKIKLKNDILKKLEEKNPKLNKKEAIIKVNHIMDDLLNINHNQKLKWLKTTYDIIEQFEKEHNIFLDKQVISNDIFLIKEESVLIESIKINSQIIRQKSLWKDTFKLENSLLDKKNELLNLSAEIIINEHTTNKDIDKITKWEITIENHVEELKNNNEKLKETLTVLENKKEKNNIVKKVLEEINQIENIDSKVNKNQNYDIVNIPEQNWDNTTIFINWKEITWINSEEYNSFIEKDKDWNLTIKNPEILKNLVDFKEKMEILNLWFVWKFRSQLIQVFKNSPWFRWQEMNITDDFINKKELNNLLNFILKLSWKEWDKNSISWTYAKIIQINWAWVLNNSKNTHTELSPIWQIFYDNKFINLWSSLTTENIMNLQNPKKWKQKKSK